MDRTEHIETLNRMLDDVRRLTQGGDPLLVGVYASLEARITLLLSLIDDDGERDDAA